MLATLFLFVSLQMPTVAFNTSEYTVSEGSDTVHVCGCCLNDIPPGGLECEVVAILGAVDGIKAGRDLECECIG